MNDYFAGHLARERQADRLREIEHDELVARAHRAHLDGEAPAPPRAQAVSRTRRRPWDLLGRLGPARIADRAHRP